MNTILKPIFIHVGILCGTGLSTAYAELLQYVDFTTQDSGYTLSGDPSGDGATGVYGTGPNFGSVSVSSAPATFSAQPTGFGGNFLAIENPNNVNGLTYPLAPLASALTPNGVVYVTLPTAIGMMTGGSVSFSFKFAAPNAGADRYDGVASGRPLAFTTLEYRVDGGAWQSAISIQGLGNINASAGAAGIGMWWDENNNGIFSDATDLQIKNIATTVNRTISGLNVSGMLETRLRIGSGTNDEMALDDITIQSAQFMPIPEPAGYGLMGAGALAAVVRLRRRARTA